MVSLITSLNTALSGLQTTQTLLNTVTRNVTNAQTPNYVAKEQHFLTNATGGGGVYASQVQRSVDEALLNKQRSSTSDLNYQQTIADALTKLNQLAGDPAQETSLAGLITKLGKSFQSLAANPNDPGTGENVLYAAENLADEFNRQTTATVSLQTSAAQSMQDTVLTVNEQLQTIASLNVRILAAEGKGIDASDLKDSRDQQVAELSKHLDIRAFYDSEGVLNIYTSDYKPLAGQYAEVVTYSATNNSLSVSSGTIANPGGDLGAFQYIANTTTTNYLTQLDSLASGITTAFSSLTASVNGTVTTGSNTLTNVANYGTLYTGQSVTIDGTTRTLTVTANAGGPPTITFSGAAATANANSFKVGTPIPLFIPDPPVTSPLSNAGQIQLNPALDQSTNYLKLLNMGTTGTPPAVTVSANWQPNDTLASTAAGQFILSGTYTFPNTTPGIGGTTTTFTSAATSVVVAIGQSLSNTQTKVTDLTTFNSQVTQSIAAKSEVNLDKELSNMVVLQNLYSSNARVIQTTQKMLDDLLGLVR